MSWVYAQTMRDKGRGGHGHNVKPHDLSCSLETIFVPTPADRQKGATGGLVQPSKHRTAQASAKMAAVNRSESQ